MLARANSGEAQIDRGKASRVADSALLHVEGATSDLGQVGRTVRTNERADTDEATGASEARLEEMTA
jgi:hypothetical protein